MRATPGRAGRERRGAGGRGGSETVWFVLNGRLTALDRAATCTTSGCAVRASSAGPSRSMPSTTSSHVVVLGRGDGPRGPRQGHGVPEGGQPRARAIKSAALSAEGPPPGLAWASTTPWTVYDLVRRPALLPGRRPPEQLTSPRSAGDGVPGSRRTSTWSCTPRPGRSRCPHPGGGSTTGALC